MLHIVFKWCATAPAAFARVSSAHGVGDLAYKGLRAASALVTTCLRVLLCGAPRHRFDIDDDKALSIDETQRMFSVLAAYADAEHQASAAPEATQQQLNPRNEQHKRIAIKKLVDILDKDHRWGGSPRRRRWAHVLVRRATHAHTARLGDPNCHARTWVQRVGFVRGGCVCHSPRQRGPVPYASIQQRAARGGEYGDLPAV